MGIVIGAVTANLTHRRGAGSGQSRSDTVVVVGMGDLGQRVVDAVARCPIGRVVAAARDEERARGVAGQAALVAAIHDGAGRVEPAHIDLEDRAATATALARLEPSVIVLTASRHTWWRVPEHAAAVPYGAWLPLHVQLTRSVMEARADAGTCAPVVALPFPDAVGPVLAGAGLAPELGAGNVGEIAAKLEVLAALRHGVERTAVDVRLVAHHATERHAFSAFVSLGGTVAGPTGPPPTHACVRVGGAQLPADDVRSLFAAPYALGRGRETHALTAATTALAVQALLTDTPQRVHVPAPGGRPGGYPARLSRAGVELDLPEGLTETDARAINAVAARWDGIEHIAQDGTVTFTPAVADATERILGLRLGRLTLDDHDAVANELMARLAEPSRLPPARPDPPPRGGE